MTGNTEAPLEPGQVYVYGVGMVYASACAPAGMPASEIEIAVNSQHPTGISSRWAMTDGKEFADGTPCPAPCDQDPETRRHYLLSC